MSKTVSIDAFWMDETEITNNEYRQFVYWVKDSLLRQALVDDQIDDYILKDKEGNPLTMSKNGTGIPPDRLGYKNRLPRQKWRRSGCNRPHRPLLYR